MTDSDVARELPQLRWMHSNHLHWVSDITVMNRSGGARPGKLEGWTGGWSTAQPVCG
jgi:hypothetical protein